MKHAVVIGMGMMYLATLAGASGPKLGPGLIKEAVDEHNKYRDMEGKNLPPMCWNETVACFAEKYAERRKKYCKLEHSVVDWPDEAAVYGENIAKCSGDMTLARAVYLWYNEKPEYSYETNACAPGKVCGHYTQVVWLNSTQVGCAKIKCDNGGIFITCNYYPPGNIQGSRPY